MEKGIDFSEYVLALLLEELRTNAPPRKLVPRFRPSRGRVIGVLLNN
jgi:hypothetical protein